MITKTDESETLWIFVQNGFKCFHIDYLKIFVNRPHPSLEIKGITLMFFGLENVFDGFVAFLSFLHNF